MVILRNYSFSVEIDRFYLKLAIINIKRRIWTKTVILIHNGSFWDKTGNCNTIQFFVKTNDFQIKVDHFWVKTGQFHSKKSNFGQKWSTFVQNGFFFIKTGYFYSKIVFFFNENDMFLLQIGAFFNQKYHFLKRNRNVHIFHIQNWLNCGIKNDDFLLENDRFSLKMANFE